MPQIAAKDGTTKRVDSSVNTKSGNPQIEQPSNQAVSNTVKKQLDIIAGALATAVIVGLVAFGTVWSIEHPPGNPPRNPPPPAKPLTAEQHALIEVGQELFTHTGTCAACHTIDGISRGQMGPPLTHIGSDAANRIPGYTAETYIRKSILASETHTAGTADGLAYDYPPGLMESTMATNANLSELDTQALVAFLMQQK